MKMKYTIATLGMIVAPMAHATDDHVSSLQGSPIIPDPSCLNPDVQAAIAQCAMKWLAIMERMLGNSCLDKCYDYINRLTTPEDVDILFNEFSRISHRTASYEHFVESGLSTAQSQESNDQIKRHMVMENMRDLTDTLVDLIQRILSRI
ncbi:MAG: hypothetical protein LBF65_02765 [Holosporales bacterium]|jgi:hypothetical protein|nr:hypothetical protein [Holosporales bacterium]